MKGLSEQEMKEGMAASERRGVVKLTAPRHEYDGDDRRIAGADIVIDASGIVIKDRQGVAGRSATAAERRRAETISP